MRQKFVIKGWNAGVLLGRCLGRLGPSAFRICPGTDNRLEAVAPRKSQRTFGELFVGRPRCHSTGLARAQVAKEVASANGQSGFDPPPKCPAAVALTGQLEAGNIVAAGDVEEPQLDAQFAEVNAGVAVGLCRRHRQCSAVPHNQHLSWCCMHVLCFLVRHTAGACKGTVLHEFDHHMRQ